MCPRHVRSTIANPRRPSLISRVTTGGVEGGLQRTATRKTWRAVATALSCALPLIAAAGTAVAHPDFDVVGREVDRLVAADPANAKLRIDQAQVRKRAGDWDGALVALAQAQVLGADPDAVDAARASVYLAAGFPRMAAFQCDTVLARRPDAFDVLFERGRSQLALGELDNADRDFARAIAGMTTVHPEHVMIRADALRARARRAEALQALDAGITRLGPLPSLELTAIDIELELQRYDSALARLDLLLRQTPTNAAWMARRAEILKQADRPEEARTEFAHALRQLETNPPKRQSPATRALAEHLREEIAADAAHKEGQL